MGIISRGGICLPVTPAAHVTYLSPFRTEVKQKTSVRPGTQTQTSGLGKGNTKIQSSSKWFTHTKPT